MYHAICQRGHQVTCTIPNRPIIFCIKCWKDDGYPYLHEKDMRSRIHLYANPNDVEHSLMRQNAPDVSEDALEPKGYGTFNHHHVTCRQGHEFVIYGPHDICPECGECWNGAVFDDVVSPAGDEDPFGVYEGYTYSFAALVNFATEHRLTWKRPGLVPSVSVGSAFFYLEDANGCAFSFIMEEDGIVQDAQLWKCVYRRDVSRETLPSEYDSGVNTPPNILDDDDHGDITHIGEFPKSVILDAYKAIGDYIDNDGNFNDEWKGLGDRYALNFWTEVDEDRCLRYVATLYIKAEIGGSYRFLRLFDNGFIDLDLDVKPPKLSGKNGLIRETSKPSMTIYVFPWASKTAFGCDMYFLKCPHCSRGFALENEYIYNNGQVDHCPYCGERIKLYIVPRVA